MIKKLLFGALLMLCAVFSFAASCDPVIKFKVTYDGIVYLGGDKADVCGKLPGGGWTAGDSCWKYNAPYNGTWTYTNYAQVLVCPDGTDPINGQCDCDPCKSKKGIDVDNGAVGPEGLRLSLNFPNNPDSSFQGSPFCSGGCKAAVTKEVGSGGIVVSGRYYGDFNAQYNGESCNTPTKTIPDKPDVTTPKPSAEYDCVQKGMGFGYVNGNVLCTKPDAGKGTATKSTTTDNSDGTKTKVDTNVTMNCTGDGSCTTTTTTTTTTTNSSGQTVGTPTTTSKTETTAPVNGGGKSNSNSSFCIENPKSPMCSSGSFAGVCGSPPVCEGDPVQCATAKSTFEQNCKSLPPGDPVDTEGPVGEKKVSVGSISPDGFLPSDGACIADKTFTVQGKTYTWSMAPLCDFAHGIRPVVILMAWLASLYIVFGRGANVNA